MLVLKKVTVFSWISLCFSQYQLTHCKIITYNYFYSLLVLYTHTHTHTHTHQFTCSVVSNSVTPWTATCQASLSITDSQSLPRLMSIELVMPSNHLILSPPSPPAFNLSQHQGLRIRWPKYWTFSFSISTSSEYSGLISFRTDWFDMLV